MLAALGVPDILVNNAGVFRIGNVVDADSRGNLESYVHFMESYVHFMRIAIAKALESTRGLLKNFKECT